MAEYSINQLARHCGVDARTIRRWVRQGVISPTRVVEVVQKVPYFSEQAVIDAEARALNSETQRQQRPVTPKKARTTIRRIPKREQLPRELGQPDFVPEPPPPPEPEPVQASPRLSEAALLVAIDARVSQLGRMIGNANHQLLKRQVKDMKKQGVPSPLITKAIDAFMLEIERDAEDYDPEEMESDL